MANGYRWSHPYAWLEFASASWDRDRLLHELRRLAIQHDSDTLQDLYQQDMNDDGYFDVSSAPAPAGDESIDPVDQLVKAYGSWGEHPRFARADWRSEVADGETNLGYWEWILQQEEIFEDDEPTALAGDDS